MKKLVLFNNNSHDNFIDFLKGFSIICVVLSHIIPSILKDFTFFCLWGDMAVPLFLLIQVFHSYKKGLNNIQIKYDVKKIWKRILFPFFIVTFATITVHCIFNWENINFYTILRSGGIGPGSYYIYIYLQFFLLLPLIGKLFSRYNKLWFIIICILLEFLCSKIEINHSLYRLLCIRYLFLIYLGYKWTTSYFILNFKRLILSMVSIIFILIFHYKNINLEPIFFNSSWKIYHWICYFYVAYLFVIILYYSYIHSKSKISNIIRWYGKNSWNIFLWQMSIISLFPYFFPKINELNYLYIVLFFIKVSICLFFPYLIEKLRKIMYE